MEVTDQKALLEKEVATLQVTLSSLTTLAQVEERARSLGFIDMTSSLLVLKPMPVAAVVTP